jgi:hypothetical protein
MAGGSMQQLSPQARFKAGNSPAQHGSRGRKRHGTRSKRTFLDHRNESLYIPKVVKFTAHLIPQRTNLCLSSQFITLRVVNTISLFLIKGGLPSACCSLAKTPELPFTAFPYIQRSTFMPKHFFRLSAMAIVALLSFENAAIAADSPPLERWRSYTGVSWESPKIRLLFPARSTRLSPVFISISKAPRS